MLIVNIPIEPVRGRYSEDWAKWFSEELTSRKFNFITIAGPPLRTEIKDGAFLDVIATTHYKSHQVVQIANAVDSELIPRNEKVIFLLHDGWFPVEQLAYMRDMLGCHDWKFLGIFHAGTYDRWDQTAQHGLYTWGEDIENGWFKIYDKIIVASDFHRNLLVRTRKVDHGRIKVIPWKVTVPQDLIGTAKENWVVFPHRHDPEKMSDLFFKFHSPFEYGTYKDCLKDYSVYDTHVSPTKRRYYEMLAKSKICLSFSLQETFGIAMVEAVLLGCIPLVPDRLSYQEMYPRCFRYKGESEFKEKLAKFCSGDVPFNQLQFLKYKFIRWAGAFFNNLEDEIHNL